MNLKHRILSLLLVLVLTFTIMGCGSSSEIGGIDPPGQTEIPQQTEVTEIDKNGEYSGPMEVADFINKYNQLPKNYITKNEAAALGWESSQGNLWDVTDEMSIGGDVFGNREGSLPSANGRKWYECDVNYNGGYRGGERLVYSNDGLIYYTKDHYKTFTEITFP